VPTSSARPDVSASHLAITSASVVTGTARSAARTPPPPTVESEHTASTRSVGQPACQAVIVCAASAIDGTSTTTTPPSASSAATFDAIYVLPVPHAARSCRRPRSRSPAAIAATASA
jgi:hypothetical protein